MIFTESAPIVVIFTKYDKLLESKKLELQADDENLAGEELDNQSNEEAKKVLDLCVRSLKRVVSLMNPPIPEPSHVNVSGIISHSLFDQCHG